MKRISQFGAAMIALTVSLGALPAHAQYANEFTSAKLVQKGTTTQSIAGSGTVQVKVRVNADGTHTVMGVEKSTNSGDNAAALEIAQNSTYKPAHTGTAPQTSFYHFVLKFYGKSEGSATASAPGGNAIDALIRSGKYSEAISKANVELLSSPGNPQLLQYLGAAQFFSGDEVTAASQFAKVPTIDKVFSKVAANAFATGAVKVSPTDPARSLEYAQRAVAMSPDSNSNFALGVAQIANKQYSDAIATMKPLHDKTTDGKTKLAIDGQLLTAYLGSNNTADADGVAAEMKQLDPNGNQASVAIGSYYVIQGNAALSAKDYDSAYKAFAQAAAVDDPKVSVTGDSGATLALLSEAKPDFAKAKDYATKWVTGQPDDAHANYWAGLAYADFSANVSHNDKDMAQGITYLKKADTIAKATNDVGLSLQVEQQLKAIQP